MKINPLITIFTPTYNRAYSLPKLYKSLCDQSAQNFVWLVVDDGSSDNTRELIDKWSQEGKVPIQYFYQENQGKPAAHNLGVEKTDTELFVCVDSDDWLLPEATQKISKIWNNQKTKRNVIGILAKKGEKTENSLSSLTHWKGNIKYSTLHEAGSNNSLTGDTMLVFKSSVIKKERFPHYQSEKFVPEAYLYDALSKYGVLYFCDEILYMCEYQADGYTASIHKVNAMNPHGYEAYVLQRINLDRNSKDRISDIVRYDSIRNILKKEKNRLKGSDLIISLLVAPIGYARFFLLYKKYLK